MINKVLFSLLAGALLLTLAFFAMTSLEVTSKNFDSYDELESTPTIFEAGWIPRWIPRSSTQIMEAHDIDTNERWLVFRFSENIAFPADCYKTSRAEIDVPGRDRADRFPGFVRNAIEEVHSNTELEFYVCSGEGSDSIAVDPVNRRAYVWSVPR